MDEGIGDWGLGRWRGDKVIRWIGDGEKRNEEDSYFFVDIALPFNNPLYQEWGTVPFTPSRKTPGQPPATHLGGGRTQKPIFHLTGRHWSFKLPGRDFNATRSSSWMMMEKTFVWSVLERDRQPVPTFSPMAEESSILQPIMSVQIARLPVRERKGLSGLSTHTRSSPRRQMVQVWNHWPILAAITLARI